MEWKDLEKLTVLKLREEALKHSEIKGVHGKSKEQLMDELAHVLGIEKPHVRFAEKIIHTKGDLKHQIGELKAQRNVLIKSKDHRSVHEIRRRIHKIKRQIKKIEHESGAQV